MRQSKNSCKKGEKKRNMMRRVVMAPIRVMGKAAELYMRFMEGCASQAGGLAQGCPGMHMTSGLPRSFSVNSSGSYKPMPRAREVHVGMEMRRSYSVGIGRIGRIDEDMPCSFEEEGDGGLLFQRSRSQAITRRKTSRLVSRY